MSQILIAHVALSFLVGGAFVAGCAVAAELLGPEIGGTIAGLPSTAAVTLFFVALTDSPAEAVRETTLIPTILALNCAFFAVFGLTARAGTWVALLAALGVWFLLAFFVIDDGPRDLGVSLAILAAGVTIGSVVLKVSLPPVSDHSVASKPGLAQILTRATAGGAVVAVGVLLSRLGGAKFGGLAAAFPAAGLSTLAIVSHARGPLFATGLLQPAMIGGSISITAYALVVRVTYESIGVYLGTAAAFSVASLSAYLLYCVRQRRRT